MNKEEILFQKRVQDMAKASYMRGIPVFSDFLSMNEISLLHNLSHELVGVQCETYGGYEFAERQMAMFVPDALFYNTAESRTLYPICALQITFAHKKFAESLTHRDYLGSILGLGIERSMIGDICVKEEGAYVFCKSTMTELLMQELSQVRHTRVCVREAESIEVVQPSFEEIKNTVASLRADAIIAMVYHLSRSSVIMLFQSQKVFVNGRLTESNSHILKEGDIVSVRGYGRFIFEKLLAVTKKERNFIQLKKMI